MIEWEDMPALPDTAAAPAYCEAGPYSHVWLFEFSPDGFGISTAECKACDAVAQSQYCDFFEYLGGTFKVRLEGRHEVYTGLDFTEHDYFIDMVPVDECSP